MDGYFDIARNWPDFVLRLLAYLNTATANAPLQNFVDRSPEIAQLIQLCRLSSSQRRRVLELAPLSIASAKRCSFFLFVLRRHCSDSGFNSCGIKENSVFISSNSTGTALRRGRPSNQDTSKSFKAPSRRSAPPPAEVLSATSMYEPSTHRRSVRLGRRKHQFDLPGSSFSFPRARSRATIQ